MSHKINIVIKSLGFPSIIKKKIKLVANTALTYLSEDKYYELTILVCDDSYMQELNRSYRGVDKTTDVLSFEENYEMPDSENKYLGDVAISYPTALRQSSQAGHDINLEISLLVVHGILHLFGYDHMTEFDKSEMWSLQSKILSTLGYFNVSLILDEANAQE